MFHEKQKQVHLSYRNYSSSCLEQDCSTLIYVVGEGVSWQEQLILLCDRLQGFHS